MKRLTGILFLLAATLHTGALHAQDNKTVETSVNELLAKLPADNEELTSMLMEEMYSLGDEGTTLICRKVISAGTGDDTRARFAIYSLTTHLSGDETPDRREVWERQCIRFMNETSDYDVKVFFMRQLNLIGSVAAAETLTGYVNDSALCADAVIALQAIGNSEAVAVLASALSDTSCPCASQVMVALADSKYAAGTQDYIRWYEDGNRAEKSSALYALAVTAGPEAETVLTNAAEGAGFAWDPTGAVSALLLYAKNIGLAGDVREMDKILKTVISRSNTAGTANQRLAAMSVTVAVKGNDALPMLLEAADDSDVVIRGGAMRLTSSLTGPEVTKKWISKFERARPEAKPEIIFMLGERGDNLAIPLMLAELKDPSQEVAGEAAGAIAKLQGGMAVDPLLTWVLNFDSESGHIAAANALTTVLDSANIFKVVKCLPQSAGHATVTLLWLLAWTGNSDFFPIVMSYTSSSDLGVRAAAITSLGRLASCNDQAALINLLENSAEKAEIEALQSALSGAAMKCADTLKRSAVILDALSTSKVKLRLVPVLSQTGGEEAMKTVLKEFENGDAETRDVCFDALAHWSDNSATTALFEIASSGNKTFGRPAFDAYLTMVSVSRLTSEDKLRLITDIAPHALAPDAKTDMIEAASVLMTHDAALFISSFLADDTEEVRRAAGEALSRMEMPSDDFFVSLFNGQNLEGWVGDKTSYVVEEEAIVIHPDSGGGGNLYTEKEYSDFIFRFEFKLTAGANNGLGIRAPLKGDAAYLGIELQIIDNTDAQYTDLKPYQFHGSVYGVIPARKGYLKPVGEWNYQEVIVKGTKITVILNGTVILDGDYAAASVNGTADGRDHPGLKNKTGHIGFLGHGSVVSFRDIRIKEL